MIQGHHLRADHEDRHYGAKYYKYLREMAVSLRDVAMFVCQDDKKKIAVGEPGLPLAGRPPSHVPCLPCACVECVVHRVFRACKYAMS